MQSDPSRRAGARRLGALLKTGALQTAILNSANFSSIATDEQGVIQIFNVGAQRMLGYAAEEVLNRITPAEISDPQEIVQRAQALSDEFHTPIEPGFEALVFQASRGIEDVYELTCVRRDGRRLPALVSVTALRDAQELIIGYLLIGTDNTARKQVEAERQRLDTVLQSAHCDLQAAKAEADRANLAKSEFLSGMSHELRSPLNAILGCAQWLDSGTPPPTAGQQDCVDQIMQAGWYLPELINEILDLALNESGKLSLSTEPMTLAEVLADCQALIEPQARKGGIRVTFAVAPQPLYGKADRTRAKQVFIKLLSNAIQYNRFGGTVEVSCQPGRGDRVRVGGARHRAGPVARQAGAAVPAFQPVGPGSRRRGRHRHRSGGQQAPGRVDGRRDRRRQQPRRGQQLLGRTARLPGAVCGGRGGRADLRHGGGHDARCSEVHRAVRGRQPHQPRMLQGDARTAHIPVLVLSANAMPRDIETGLAAGFIRYLTRPIRLDAFMQVLDAALDHNSTSMLNTEEAR